MTTWQDTYKLGRLSGVPINFWSSGLDNVKWSKDNIIAVGGLDDTAFIAPKLKSPEVTGEQAWISEHCRTNIFSDQDVPLMLPQAWKYISFGEEQSEAHCLALDWSPPGLGKHGRCVLGLLSSNHMLQLWECQGKPDGVGDWQRIYYVNHALMAYNATTSLPVQRESQEDRNSRLQAMQRIRAFTWSHVLTTAPMAGFSGACAPLSRPYLAVSNDLGDVFIMKVKPPYDLLSPDTAQWSAEVLQRVTVPATSHKKNPLAACMPAFKDWTTHFVDQLTWGPWSKDASGNHASLLAYTCDSTLYLTVVKATVTADDVVLEVGATLPNLVDTKLALPAGPMQWAPKAGDGDEMYLIYPCRKVMYCITVNLKKAGPIRVTKRPIENVWDELAGITFNTSANGKITVHFAYYHDSGAATTLGWSLPFEEDAEPVSSPEWHNSVKKSEALFSEENGLGDRVQTRTYGITGSPLGDYSAVNVSFHPSEGNEYVIYSDQLSSLRVIPIQEKLDLDVLPERGGPSNAYDISAETLLFSFQRIFETMPESTLSPELLVPTMLRTLDLFNAPDAFQNNTFITEDTPVRAIVQSLRENMLFNRQAIYSRTKRLATFVAKKVPRTPLLDPIVVRSIATHVANLPQFLSESSDLSHTISNIHTTIVAKLDERDGAATDHMVHVGEDLELCEICGSGIAFESLRWARCANGHQRYRCNLSFLTIQRPNSTKNCGICNAQYLDELKLPGLEHVVGQPDAPIQDNATIPSVPTKQGTTGKEPLNSLARILFSAIDRCVCCGGRFVG